jgi:hypothetical protein
VVVEKTLSQYLNTLKQEAKKIEKELEEEELNLERRNGDENQRTPPLKQSTLLKLILIGVIKPTWKAIWT